ncbi:hypothetical protein [Butyrivibrio fibrisolvens]|uniref:hypothetical protein n=1 Tax=Butyrivibrio fibrisolvens TaxID=831 RepID=UPI001A98AEE5|nr:hypothetical protein [Butyrivibrio fibrisolvens]
MAKSQNYKILYSEKGVDFIFSSKAFRDCIHNKKIESKKSNDKKASITQIQNEIAEVVSMSFESVKKWVKGHNGPNDISIVKDIAGYFAIDFRDLLISVDDGESKQNYNTIAIIAGDEKNIVIQFHALLTDLIYTYVGNDDWTNYVSYYSIDAPDYSIRIYDLYRELEKVSLEISSDSYTKLHRLISECNTLLHVGCSTTPYYHIWLESNDRWASINPRLEIISEYAEYDDQWEAKDFMDVEELLKEYRNEVGYTCSICKTADETSMEYRDDFLYYDSFQAVPMEYAKTLSMLFRKDFPHFFNV